MVHVKTSRAAELVLIAIAMLIAGPAMADKPGGGGGRQDKHPQKEQRQRKEKYQQKEQHYNRDGRQSGHNERSYDDRDRPSFSGGRYFADRHRAAIRDYYTQNYRGGHCPPGLAKKHNGCFPPGQAKKWALGQRLPRDVIFYDLPPEVAYSIGAPPPGYRFVRVASDILMISIGTGLVIDAINDLGRY